MLIFAAKLLNNYIMWWNKYWLRYAIVDLCVLVAILTGRYAKYFINGTENVEHFEEGNLWAFIGCTIAYALSCLYDLCADVRDIKEMLKNNNDNGNQSK